MCQTFFKIFFTVLIVLDPLGIIPQFLSLTSSLDDIMRKKVVKKAIFVAALVLALFVLCGKILLTFFGITPGAFYISGGILFFLIAFQMIYSKPARIKHTPNTEDDNNDTMMVAVFPLAIPFIAGPGLLTIIMLYVSNPTYGIDTIIMLVIALILGLIVEFITLRFASVFLQKIGRTGMFVIEKIMGIILSGFAVQLIYEGFVKLNIIK